MSNIITENLHEELLIHSLRNGRPNLCAISGYVSAPFVKQVLDAEVTCKISVIVGMVGSHGIGAVDHRGFRVLESVIAPGRFRCLYYAGSSPCHIKAYAFQDPGGNKQPSAYVGSANFTWNGFNENLEVLNAANAAEVIGLFKEIERDSISCLSNETDRFVLSSELLARSSNLLIEGPISAAKIGVSIEISLLNAAGEMHGPGGGLNWGQPQPGKRERSNTNEAYIPIPRVIHKKHPGFFPSRSKEFAVECDDGKFLWLSVSSGSDNYPKDLRSPRSNAELGTYLRTRLGVPNGAPFTKKHLEDYGRTTVTLTKLGDGTYYFDFSLRKARTS